MRIERCVRADNQNKNDAGNSVPRACSGRSELGLGIDAFGFSLHEPDDVISPRLFSKICLICSRDFGMRAAISET